MAFRVKKFFIVEENNIYTALLSHHFIFNKRFKDVQYSSYVQNAASYVERL